MRQNQGHFFRVVIVCVFFAALAALAVPATAEVTSVAKTPDPVGKYDKLELTVGLSATYKNPYDPDEIDLSAEFTSPAGKVWKINGFYDGAAYKVRFAANETGTWNYVVSAKDAGGTTKSKPGTFTCIDSKHHGWVTVAPNKRYLRCDDGTSFYGVGACHAWSVSTRTMDQMKAAGFNTYVYWNGTYDTGGGNALIESTASGVGKYDQRKCARLDELIAWGEARDIGMVLVLLPHDYGCEKVGGWPIGWPKNPYKDIVSSSHYYDDPKSWAYQQKQYRYVIARWGYSRGILSWQTVDEISGTNGWVANQATANEWAAKMAKFFQTNDPFKHPTTASHGSFWDQGNKSHDLPNTEVYGAYNTGRFVGVIQKLWNGYTKPCIMGETGGGDRDGSVSHQKIWAGLAAGIAITPLIWQFNQGWNENMSAQFPPFNRFIADINFGGLTNPAQGKVSVPGADAYGITSDQITFGWISGGFKGKSLKVSGLKNGGYRMEWWDCKAGKMMSTSDVTVTDGSATSAIPETSQADIAYKIIAAK
jgi:hypothetical protein